MTHSIKFYTDEMIDKAILRGLRRRGIDVLSAPDARMMGKSDRDHLALAIKTGRALLTRDEDFLTLASATVEHPGIIYAQQQKSVGKVVKFLIGLWDDFEPEEIANQVHYV